MSDDGSLFLATSSAVGEVAGWVGPLLGLEPSGEEDGDLYFWRPGSVGLQFTVGGNPYREDDPAPDDVQAMDGYPIEVHLRFQRWPEEQVRAETMAAFDKVVAARPDLAVLACQSLAWLIAAYLPGRGTKYFGPRTTPDVEDRAVWEPWIQA